jgi:transcriptional regulator HMO1
MNDTATVLSQAFRNLSDALHTASVACKDLEYTIPLLAGRQPPAAATTSATGPAAPEKQKRVRDPNEPKRPQSAYLLFLSKAREDVHKSGGVGEDMKPADVMSKLASMWNELSEKERAPYEAEAEKLKGKYLKDREQYEKDHPSAARKKRRTEPAAASTKGAAADKVLSSPVASSAAATSVTPKKTSAAPKETPSKSSAKDKKDKTPKSDKKDKGKEKEKEKKRGRKSDVKA